MRSNRLSSDKEKQNLADVTKELDRKLKALALELEEHDRQLQGLGLPTLKYADPLLGPDRLSLGLNLDASAALPPEAHNA